MNKTLGLLLFSFLISIYGFAKDVFPLTSPVMDQVGILNPDVSNSLKQKLSSYYEETEIQITVVVIKSLEGEAVASYAMKLFDSWKLGKEKTDKGVVFLISIDDRATNISVGQGLEGDLTDLKSRRILDNVSSYYKDNKFDEGTLYVIDSIIKTVEKEAIDTPKGAPQKNIANSIDIVKTVLLIVVIIVAIIISGFVFGFDGFIIIRILLDILFIIISMGGKGGGGWSGGGGKSSGGGSSGKF